MTVELPDRDYQTVFLLGAGATRGAIPHVVLNRKRLRPPLNTDFFKVAGTLVRAQGGNSGVKQRLERVRRFFRDVIPVRGDPTMEAAAFSLLYSAKDFPEIYGKGRGRRPVAGERREVEDFLSLAFEMLGRIDDNAPSGNGYDRLVSKLGLGDTIVSLNYDTALDSALWRCGWNPTTGYALPGSPRKTSWRPQNVGSASRLESVRLLKLHGSLNWFVRGSYSNLSAVFQKKPVSVTAPRRNSIGGHLRQIVPPIYGKFFEHSHWESLWAAAFQAFRNAEIFVLIGCSLEDTDFHLRAFVSRVRQIRRQEGRFRRLYLIDQSLLVRRKWRDAMKGTCGDVRSLNRLEAFLKKELKV